MKFLVLLFSITLTLSSYGSGNFRPLRDLANTVKRIAGVTTWWNRCPKSMKYIGAANFGDGLAAVCILGKVKEKRCRKANKFVFGTPANLSRMKGGAPQKFCVNKNVKEPILKNKMYYRAKYLK